MQITSSEDAHEEQLQPRGYITQGTAEDEVTGAGVPISIGAAGEVDGSTPR